MAHNSSNSNYENAVAAASNNFSSNLHPVSPPPGFNPIIANPNKPLSNYCSDVNGVGQLALNPRVNELRKTSLGITKSAWARANANENGKTNEIVRSQFSCPTPTSLEETQNIMRASQIVRAQLANAASLNSEHSARGSNDVVVDSDEKKKAREMLQAQLLLTSVLPPKNDVVGGTAKPTSIDTLRTQLLYASKIKDRLVPPLKTHRFNSNNFHFSQPIFDVDEGIEILCPSPLTGYFSNESSKSNINLQNLINPINQVEIISDDEGGSEYDGRLHSLPYKKNGPYTCPKCKHVFGTSQRFAAHVSSNHYKYETKEQRRKRLMAKIRGRSLRIHRVNDGLTFVPVSSSSSAAAGNNSNQNHEGARFGEGGFAATVKVEAVEVESVEVVPPPPPSGKELVVAGAGGVKIKLEPVDS
ncbi:hypothetical protein VNO77_11831 [Canavalia gladiata]|uniref:C2H2-type domain-containing protein n=1 Tax=Canavalia gladiata TaxID=3824 RepID=A0AAN9M0R7_CANGL